ncbi:MAG: glycine cleavage system aminomethyltransferase GcvT [Oscillospiraceae bacterium]|nr:glycine cleavage system aminomethyltransferase GcvT [Oscillospiraceae bacterium]
MTLNVTDGTVCNTPKKTALYDRHVKLGGSLVDFAGYMLPVRYETGVIAEHKAVRTAAGLFDVSHMGEFDLRGDRSTEFLQYLLCNDYSDMPCMSCRYSPLLNDDGGCVDDLIVYKYADFSYMIVVNASNKDKDFEWIKSRLWAGLKLKDISGELSEIALQGPKSLEILSTLADSEELPKKYYTFNSGVEIAGKPCIVSRTGYTGEDGYEIYAENDEAGEVWDAILEAGKDLGVIPCGLGARDTLRLEAAMPLYGHELSDDITPLEASLASYVKLDKPCDFIGKAALIAKGAPTRKRVGLRVTGKGIAREGCKVFSADHEIGRVTSGTMLPTLEGAYAMALLKNDYAAADTVVDIDVRGRRIAAVVVPLPFYKRKRNKTKN